MCGDSKWQKGLGNEDRINMAGHVILIGMPGIGMSCNCISNNIIAAVCKGNSVVVTDPKGN